MEIIVSKFESRVLHNSLSLFSCDSVLSNGLAVEKTGPPRWKVCFDNNDSKGDHYCGIGGGKGIIGIGRKVVQVFDSLY